MRIAILGGSGYLASCLSYYLKNKNQITLATRNVRKITISHQNIKKIKINYSSLKSLEKVCKNKDFIFHLVGANSKYSKNNKTKSLELKKKVTKKLLTIAKKNNTKLIYFSSSQVYKYINLKNINENSVTNNNNAYTKNHLIAEKLILNCNKIYKTKHLIVRFSSIFGMPYHIKSPETFNLIINSMCKKAIKDNIINIKNSSVLRNFIPSRALMNFEKYVLNSKNHEILNFGFKSFYLVDVAKIIKKICKQHFGIVIKLNKHKISGKKNKPTFKSLFINKRIQNKDFHLEIKNLLKIIKNEKK